MTDVSHAGLAALAAFAQRFSIDDVAVAADDPSLIFLLGRAKKLKEALRMIGLVGDHGDRGRNTIYTWGDLDYLIPKIMERAGAAPLTNDVDWSSSISVIPIPAPGGPQVRWWSAKRQQLMSPVRLKPFRLCVSEDAVKIGDCAGPALLKHHSRKLPPIFMSHGVDFTSMRHIQACGGLLWPSLAITWKVPPSYGDVLFLADIRTLVGSLRPAGKLTKSIVTFGTDSFTMTGRQFERFERAITWELMGDRRWWNGDRSADEGSRGLRDVQNTFVVDELLDDLESVGTSSDDEAQTPIKSMGTVWRRIDRLYWRHADLSGGQYEYAPHDVVLQSIQGGDMYHYMETKVRKIVDLNSFVACFIPSDRASEAHDFLDVMGFEGWRLPFEWNGRDASLADDEERASWAKTVTEAILRWSDEPCGYDGAVIPSIMERSSESYEAIATWYPSKSSGGQHLVWGGGACANPPPICDPTRKPLSSSVEGERVRVHLNLHNGCYSITRSGKVAGYSEALVLRDVTVSVQKSGYERCRREHSRNVHAFLSGTLEDANYSGGKLRGGRRLSYNCLTGPPCFYYVDDGDCFTGAAKVVCLPGGQVWASE